MSVPCDRRFVTMTFDLCAHRMIVHTSDKRTESFALEPMTVAEFYERLTTALARLDVRVHLWPVPVEVSDVTPFTDDRPPRRLRSAEGREVPSRSPQHRSRLRDRSRSLRRQVQPRSLLLGRVRPRGHAFLGAAEPESSRRPGHARGVLARGDQPRLLAWWGLARQGARRGAHLLRVRRSGAGGAAQREVQPPAARYDETLGEVVLPYEAVRIRGPSRSACCSSSWRAPISRLRSSPDGTSPRFELPSSSAASARPQPSVMIPR